jgi:uncharacterized membrane protein YdcZ (DUF606 family)
VTVRRIGLLGAALFFLDFAYGYYLSGHRPLYPHPHEPWVVYFKGVQAVVYVTRSEATIFNVGMAASVVLFGSSIVAGLVSRARRNDR